MKKKTPETAQVTEKKPPETAQMARKGTDGGMEDRPCPSRLQTGRGIIPCGLSGPHSRHRSAKGHLYREW